MGISPRGDAAPRDQRGPVLSGRSPDPRGGGRPRRDRWDRGRRASGRGDRRRRARRARLRDPSPAGGIGRVGHRAGHPRERRAVSRRGARLPARGGDLRRHPVALVGRLLGRRVRGGAPGQGHGHQPARDPADPRRLPPAARARPVVGDDPGEGALLRGRGAGRAPGPVRAEPGCRVERLLPVRHRRAARLRRVQLLVLSREHDLADRALAAPRGAGEPGSAAGPLPGSPPGAPRGHRDPGGAEASGCRGRSRRGLTRRWWCCR